MCRHRVESSVLLGGGTDPTYVKIAANGADMFGPAGQDDAAPGIFVCAVGCLFPLFLTKYLIPTTASIGWLTFYQPIPDNHVVLVPPPTKTGEGRVRTPPQHLRNRGVRRQWRR